MPNPASFLLYASQVTTLSSILYTEEYVAVASVLLGYITVAEVQLLALLSFIHKPHIPLSGHAWSAVSELLYSSSLSEPRSCCV